VDEATWAALAAALTVAGAIWTWIAFRRRGAANGLRALGFTLLPAAAYLTGTLEMLTEITGSVTDWATSLVFNPLTWTGVGLAGLSVVLWVVSGVLRDRQLARGRKGGAAVEPGTQAPAGRRTELPTSSSRGSSGPVVDDDMAEIEALLKKRGIQ
jgi:hypothetical protein